MLSITVYLCFIRCLFLDTRIPFCHNSAFLLHVLSFGFILSHPTGYSLVKLEQSGRCSVVSVCSQPCECGSECSFYKCSGDITRSHDYSKKQTLFTYLRSKFFPLNLAFPLPQVSCTLVFTLWLHYWCCKLLGAKLVECFLGLVVFCFFFFLLSC